MKVSTADIVLKSLTPYSQSRFHEEPMLKGELHGDYDQRTWKSHLRVNKDGFVIIPSDGLLMSITAGAKYSKKQIKGQGKATWTAKFRAGLAIFDDIVTNVHEKDVDFVDIYANADGVRGSGKRVMRRYPIMHQWRASFQMIVLDPIITDGIFQDIVDLSGMFIGIGRYRPEVGGGNGRYKIESIKWTDNREVEDALKR